MKAETYKTTSSSCRQLRCRGAWRRMSLALLLFLFTSMTAWADDPITGNCGTSVTYSFDGKTLTISGTGAMANYSSADDQPWKDYKYEIESLVIKKGVTSIGDYAFAECNLQSITYEAGTQLTIIGASAFEGCSSLAAVYIPSSVTTIGDNAFANCYYQNVFVCPDTPPTLGENVFGEYYQSIYFIVRSNTYTTTTGWKDLSNMTVGDANNFNIPYIDAEGNTFICPYAVPIPSGDFSWNDNGNLWFYISGTDEVESYLYFNQWDWGTINLIICDDAERTIKYLNSNQTLNIYGQENNTGKLTIVNNFYGKGIYAEYGLTICGGIIEVSNAPNGISSSGDITINGGKITVTGASTDGGIYSSSGNITINGGKISSTATGNASGIYSFSGNVTINGGEIISSATGYGIYSTSGSITLGDAIITASSYCGSVTIADGLTLSDGNDAYSGTLYDGTGNGKFEDLDALNTALAGQTLQKLPAYIDLSATLVWNDNNDQYYKRPTSVTVSLKGNGTQIGTYELTGDENGEWKCTVNKPSLSNGTLIVYTWDVPNMPNGYGLTGNSADGTTTTLTLTLQQCGENVAWNYDASSKTLTISGSGAMDDYSSADDQPWSSFSDDIESLLINKDVTSIGNYAFTECTKLESVTYEAGSTLENIGASAFAGCSSLTSINIPAGVTSIGASAFADCENLGSVTYAAGTQLETIGENAFAACSSLASIIIPVGVTGIGASAFESCASLTSVTAYPQTPPTLGNDAFKNINEDVAFTVRNEDYETADGWSAWANKMTILDPSQFLPYIDADGNEAFCTNATKITSDCMYYGGTDEEDDLWYYVDGTVDISNYIQFQDFSGSTNIILCDGASLKVNYLEANNAINIYRQGGNTPGKITTTGSNNGEYGLYAGNGDLSIYGGTIEISGSTNGIFSSGGNITIADCNITISDKGGFTAWANYWGGGDILINSGNITITEGNIYASKGENESGKGGNITINGGEITIDGGKFWSEGGNITITDGTITVEGYSGFESDGDVTINGGKITATPTGDNSYGISAGGSVTINGGEITATATGSGSYGIYAGNDITLGDAIITASSYEIYGSFKIADGLVMSEGSKAYSGTLYDYNNTDNGKFEDLDALNAALAGKTLQKLPDYIDLTARIVWNDNNNQYNMQPTSVNVKLMADGAEVEGATFELSGNNEWNCTVQNQPSLNEGELIDYSWEVTAQLDDYVLMTSTEGTATTLTLSVTVPLFAEGTSNQWMTWCDKNAYTKPEGVTVYTVSGVDDNTVSTTEVSGDVIPAYTPVLLYRSTVGVDAVKAVFNAVGTAPEGYNGIVERASGNATFLGNPGDEPYASGSNNIFAISDFSDTQSYVLRNGNFVAVDEDGGIGAHRCWLNVTKSTTNGARMLRINTGGENTGIETTNFTNSTNSSGAWYGIDGRKLDKQPTKKGLYINNGKKYVIK